MIPRDRAKRTAGMASGHLRFSLPNRIPQSHAKPAQLRASLLEPDAPVYRPSETEGGTEGVNTECAYCGLWTPVWTLRQILVGHLIQVCPECRKGKSRCDCGSTEEYTWVPMSKRVQACPLCADVYDAVYIRAHRCMSKAGVHYEPYLDDSESPMRARDKRKAGPSQDALEFYGAVHTKAKVEAKAPAVRDRLQPHHSGGVVTLSEEWRLLMAAPWGEDGELADEIKRLTLEVIRLRVEQRESDK